MARAEHELELWPYQDALDQFNGGEVHKPVPPATIDNPIIEAKCLIIN